MDTSKILRPEELPFHCQEHLVIAINELIDALGRDDKLSLDACLDEVEGSARGVSEENDAWIRSYFITRLPTTS